MYTTIHSFKKSSKQRSKSQNNTEQISKISNKLYLSRRQVKRCSVGKIQLSRDMYMYMNRNRNMGMNMGMNMDRNMDMNILVNGMRIGEICSPMAKMGNGGRKKEECNAGGTGWDDLHQQQQQGQIREYDSLRGDGCKSPKKITRLKQYIYRKYLTQFGQEDQLNAHAQGIIKLRQLFNHKLKQTHTPTHIQFPNSQSTHYRQKPPISKILQITNPDLYAMTYMRRNGRFRTERITPNHNPSHNPNHNRHQCKEYSRCICRECKAGRFGAPIHSGHFRVGNNGCRYNYEYEYGRIEGDGGCGNKDGFEIEPWEAS